MLSFLTARQAAAATTQIPTAAQPTTTTQPAAAAAAAKTTAASNAVSRSSLSPLPRPFSPRGLLPPPLSPSSASYWGGPSVGVGGPFSGGPVGAPNGDKLRHQLRSFIEAHALKTLNTAKQTATTQETLKAFISRYAPTKGEGPPNDRTQEGPAPKGPPSGYGGPFGAFCLWERETQRIQQRKENEEKETKRDIEAFISHLGLNQAKEEYTLENQKYEMKQILKKLLPPCTHINNHLQQTGGPQGSQGPQGLGALGNVAELEEKLELLRTQVDALTS